MRIALMMSRTAIRYLNKRRRSKGAIQHLVSQGHTVHHYLAFGLQNSLAGWRMWSRSWVNEKSRWPPNFGTLKGRTSSRTFIALATFREQSLSIRTGHTAHLELEML